MKLKTFDDVPNDVIERLVETELSHLCSLLSRYEGYPNFGAKNIKYNMLLLFDIKNKIPERNFSFEEFTLLEKI